MRTVLCVTALVTSLIGASGSCREGTPDASRTPKADSARILFYATSAMPEGSAMPEMRELTAQPTALWSPAVSEDSIIVAIDGVKDSATATLTLSLGVRHIFEDDSGPRSDSASAYQPRWLQWKTTAPVPMVTNPKLATGRQVLVIVPSALLAEARRLGARSDESVVSVRVLATISGMRSVEKEILILPSI